MEVWSDTNGDGVRDPGEPPLSDIQVITNYGADHTVYAKDRTGQEGTAEVGAISQDCDWENYSVTVVGPAGYAFSTPPIVTFSEVSNGGRIGFGFKPASSTPIRPVEPTQSAPA